MDISWQITAVTYIIIAITVIFSLIGFNDRNFIERYLFIPYNIKHFKEGYRFVTHMLLHADWMHLFFNMFALYGFGRFVEYVFTQTHGQAVGNLYFAALYILGGLFATLWPFFRHRDNPNYRSLGASGAVAAVIFCGIMFAPTIQIYFFFIKMPGWLFGIAYLVFEFWSNKRGNTGIAHDAHIGGAAFGIVFALITNIDLVKASIQTLFT